MKSPSLGGHREDETGQVRIIGGKWRRRKLTFPLTEALRATPDRVRETLFNWLRRHVDGARCLDLFAGSGALGFEAASRGAAEVVMVERDLGAASHLRDQVQRLGAYEVTVINSDAMVWLDGASRPFDIAFVDPPFGHAGLLARACAVLEGAGWLDAGAVVYLETGRGQPLPILPPNWSVTRSARAGQVEYYLVERRAPGA